MYFHVFNWWFLLTDFNRFFTICSPKLSLHVRIWDVSREREKLVIDLCNGLSENAQPIQLKAIMTFYTDIHISMLSVCLIIIIKEYS